MSILLVVTLGAIVIGLICGRLYSFVALLLVTPLIALVAFLSANTQSASVLGAIGIAIVSVVLLQGSYLAGARLRLRNTATQSTLTPKHSANSGHVVSRDAGQPNG